MTTKTLDRPAFNPYLPIPSPGNDDCVREDPDANNQANSPLTYQAERAPNKQEIRDLLKDEIRHLVLEEVGRHAFITTTPTELNIGTGTKSHVRLTRSENGDIQVSPFQDFQLIQSRRSKNPFSEAWKEMLGNCNSRITNHLDNRFPRNALSGISEPDIKKMATSIANSTLAITGYGFTKNPTQLASSVLHKFLGKDKVSRTLRIAGSRATICDFLIIQERTELFTTAHELNPNATVLWFTWAKVSQINKLETGAIPETTPEEIIEQARLIFMNPRTFNSQMNDEDWKSFCNLNRIGVNHYPPAQWNKNISNICKASTQAGTMPSYSAIREMSKAHQPRIYVKAQMLEPFITESQRRMKNPRLGTQKQLAAEFRALGNHMRFHPQAAPSDDRTREWEAWRNLLPPDWAKNQPKEAKPKRNDPTRRRSTQRPTTRATATAAREMTQILKGPAGQAVMKLVENAVTLESEPGSHVILRTEGDIQPHLIIQRAESGNIIFNSREYWTQGMNIPNPDPDSESESDAEFELNSRHTLRRPSMLNYRLRSRGNNKTRWTLRGLYQRTARKLAINMIQKDWAELRTSQDQPVPTQKVITTALNTFWSTQPKELQPWTRDGILSLKLERSIAEMADQETWNQVNELGLGVNISRYNIAAGMKDLIRTNPGAAIWAMTHCQPTEEIRHPGQVIRMAKEHLDDHGADPRCWKFIASLPVNPMQELIQRNPDISNAIFLLNAMGRGSAVPHQMVVERISNETAYKDREIGLQNENGQVNPNQVNNLIRVIQLTCQESSDNHENEDAQSRIVEESTEITDYVRHMNREGRPVESRTYRGLARKSDLWHRELNEERINRQWNELIQRQNGQYRAWTSAIDQPFTEGPYTITPLKSEYDLYRESLNMNHCVIQYGQQCSNHSSRIFSIRMNGRKLATTQISNTPQGWDPAQTKGPHNHPVSDDLREIAGRIAELYSEKHSAAPERYEKTWMEPARAASLEASRESS